jgi:hypothetical protein
MAKRRKVVRISTAQAVSRLDMMIPVLYRNVVNAIRIEATMEAGNALVQTLTEKSFPGADAFNCIMQSLALDLAMHLARLYDIGVHNVPVNKRDIASIPLAVRLLRQKRCQVELKRRARDWLPHDRAYASVFESDCERALARASAGYSSTFQGQFGRSGLKTLKSFRNAVMAHSLMTDVDVRPIYNQLFRLTDCARDFVEEARLAASGDPSNLKEQEEIFTEQANQFWRMAFLNEDNHDFAPWPTAVQS